MFGYMKVFDNYSGSMIYLLFHLCLCVCVCVCVQVCACVCVWGGGVESGMETIGDCLWCGRGTDVCV